MKDTCLPYYSNPPIHGARIVDMILRDQELKNEWEKELATIKERLDLTRT